MYICIQEKRHGTQEQYEKEYIEVIQVYVHDLGAIASKY